MIKAKNPKAGVQKVDERKRKPAPQPKLVVKQLLNKYSAHKANNMFSRLGSSKRPRSASQHGGHVHWQGNLYDQQPYFSMEPTYWGPRMFSQFSPHCFSSSAPYPTRRACYFQQEWIPSEHVHRGPLHEKGARFNKKVRPRDVSEFRGNNEKPISKTSNPRRRQSTHEKYIIGGQKLMWMPVKRAELKVLQNSVAGQGQIAEGVVNAKETSSNDGIGSVQEKEDVNDVQPQQTISNQYVKVINPGPNMQARSDKPLVVSSCTSQTFKSASLHADSIIRSSSLRPSTSLSPVGFKSTSTSTQRGDSTSRRSKRVRANEQMVLSAKDRLFVPKTALCQCRPGNSGGNMIMSVAPGTKLEPQWCPSGLTHTQKRRVQRLRALKIREEIAEKKRDERFNRDRPMVPPEMIWKKKCIVVDKSRNVDDMVADEISEKFRDAATNMDAHQGE
jgi:hypothetical protein